MAKKKPPKRSDVDAKKLPTRKTGRTIVSRILQPPIRTLVASAVIAPLLFVGGHHMADRIRDAQTARQPMSRAEIIAAHDVSLNKDALGKARTLDRTRPEFALPSRVMGSRVYPNSSYCLQCHSYADADERAKALIGRSQKHIDELFGKDLRHSDAQSSVFVYYPSGKFESKGQSFAAWNVPSHVKVSLSRILDSGNRSTLFHELIHHLVLHPFDQLNEPLAYTSELLSNPREIHWMSRDEKYASPRRLIYAVRLMQRCDPYLRGGLGEAELSLEKTEHYSIFSRLATRISSRDIRGMVPLVGETIRQYQKNTVYWDAASAWLSHPHLLTDVLIARRLQKEGNPLFREALESPGDVRKMIGFFKFFSKQFGIPPTEAKTYFSGMPVDLRQLVLNPSDRVDPQGLLSFLKDRSPQERDALYFASLHQHFVNSRGQFREDAVPKSWLRETAQDRLTYREDLSIHFNRKAFFGHSGQDWQNIEPTLAPLYAARRKTAENVLNRVESQLRRNRYLK